MRNFILGIVFVFVMIGLMEYIKNYRYDHFDGMVLTLSK